MEAWYAPVTPESIREWRDLLEDDDVAKVGHNLKYDYEVLKQSGITLGPLFFDSMLASYLLHPGARLHSLDTLAVQELDHHAIPITDLIGVGPNQKKMSEVPLIELVRYAAEDAELAWRLYEAFTEQIKDQGLTRVLIELEVPLVPVLGDIELSGVYLNAEVLDKLGEKLEGRIAALQADIWKEAGEEFNINSTQQLRRILFEKLNLPTVGITRKQSGFSTGAAELAKLVDHHSIIAQLEEYRELSKLKNTYIDTLPLLVDKKTGRLHASFNQTVAATGRLSSSDPNLQNIPVRTELGQEIRRAFEAEPGRVLIKADYSQLELRVAAHLSQDEKMIDAFRSGADIHRSTAAWVNGVKLEEVTDKQRRAAKALNFGVLYGMGPQKFARSADISYEEARSFIERYRKQYSGITKFVEDTLTQARTLGYVETMFGRRRYMPEINANAPAIRAQAERAAFNFPIQGTAADILKKAMIELHDRLQNEHPDAAMVLTVHDELVCEAPAEKAEAVAHLMKSTMEQTIALDVPMLVEVGLGRNWRDIKEVGDFK